MPFRIPRPTPGLSWLFKMTPTLLSPALTVFVACHAYLFVLPTSSYAAHNWSPLYIAALLLALPVWLVFNIAYKQRRHRKLARTNGAVLPRRFDGRWPGNVDLMLEFDRAWNEGYMGESFDAALDAVGPTVTLRFLWNDMVFTTEPNHVKTILATEFENFRKHHGFMEASEGILGSGVFNTNGSMWKFHRSLTRPFFSKERISDFDIFERHSSRVISKLRERLSGGHAVDMQDLFSRFTLDSATEFLFGRAVDSLDATLPMPYKLGAEDVKEQVHPSDAFAEAFTAAQELIGARTRMSWMWPLFEIFGDKAAAPMRAIDAFISPIADQALTRKATDRPSEETLLSHLIEATEDRKVIQDQIMNILIAGRDTTAATLTFVFYFLSQHPEVSHKLREEIGSVVGSDCAPTYDNIRDMKYLRAVVNETLRLLPPVPYDAREAINESFWHNPDPDGKPFYIPAGTHVMYSIFHMHRRTDLWGPDAHVFDPERFLTSDPRYAKYLRPDPFIFMPFNAGPRICLGQQFAYNETSYMIVRLLQQFSNVSIKPEAQHPDGRPPAEWEGEPGRKGMEKIWPAAHLTMYAKKGLWVTMSEASSDIA